MSIFLLETCVFLHESPFLFGYSKNSYYICVMTVKELKTLLESVKNDNMEVVITDIKSWRTDNFKEENCHIINNMFQIHF